MPVPVQSPAPGWAVKDSFAALDLDPMGFHLLFEARWIIGRQACSARPVRSA